jgi:hypothetical protein
MTDYKLLAINFKLPRTGPKNTLNKWEKYGKVNPFAADS